MTLLVGVLCSDGVVIGADSAATLGVPNQPTVRQSVPKVEIVGGCALIATSGPIGLGQRLAGEFRETIEQHKLPTGMKSHKVMLSLRKTFFEHIGPEMQAAAVAAQLIGSSNAQVSAVSQTLLAMSVDGKARLYEFDAQGAPEEKTASLPFVCLGSGQMLADPFMAFLRGIFWEDGKLPTLNEGLFATVWTLTQAIAVSPAYIALPIGIFTLRQSGASCQARQVNDSELGELGQAVAGAREWLGQYRRVDPTVESPPEP